MGIVNFTPAPGGGGGENVFPWRYTSDLITDVNVDDFAVYLTTTLEDTNYEINLPAVPGGEKLFQIGIAPTINSGCTLIINAPAGGTINGVPSFSFDQAYQGILVQSTGVSGTTYNVIAYNSNVAGVPGLQAVTNVGNTTTNTVSMRGLFLTGTVTLIRSATPYAVDNTVSQIICDLRSGVGSTINIVLPNNAGFVGRIFKISCIRDVAFNGYSANISVNGGGTINQIPFSRLSLIGEVHEYQCIAAGVYTRIPTIRTFGQFWRTTLGAPASTIKVGENQLTSAISVNVTLRNSLAMTQIAGNYHLSGIGPTDIEIQTTAPVTAGAYDFMTVHTSNI